MGKRIILFLLGISCFIFLFYLTSYQTSFQPNNPLNLLSFDKSKKNFEEEQAKLAALHSEGEQLEKKVVSDIVVIDLNDPMTKKGHDIYHEIGQCIQCHGDQGQGNPEKKAPLLAGQGDWYSYEQLIAFKNGNRKNEAMLPFIQKLNDDDLKAVSAYIQLLRVKPPGTETTATNEVKTEKVEVDTEKN